jgi:hypothetical protein
MLRIGASRWPTNAGLVFVFVLALAVPVAAMPHTDCRERLATASTGMDAALAQLKTIRGNDDESCGAYRHHFFTVVKARAAAALCTNGAERAHELGRFDNAVELINVIIAERCPS